MLQVKKVKSTNPSTKELGFVFRQVNIGKTTEKDVANSLALGGTYSVGESKGILTDFGNHLASLLANNNRVIIDGLGTFELSTKSGWSKDAADLKKTSIKLGINFTPSAEILDTISKAEIKVVTNATMIVEDDTDSPTTDESENNNGNVMD